jgi:predicted dehydrogenase
VGCFTYYNRDPKNIRNILEYGGGALMDIGCYGVYISRLVFGEEPTRVLGLIEEDPEMRTDVMTSVMLHFRSGQCVFTCGTQLVPYQRVQILGTQGRIEVEIPLNAPPDQRCRVFIDDGVDSSGRSAEILEFETCNQYTIQGDLFSQSVRQDTELLVPLEDSVRNMAVIEAIFRSAKSGKWDEPLVTY